MDGKIKWEEHLLIFSFHAQPVLSFLSCNHQQFIKLCGGWKVINAKKSALALEDQKDERD